VHSPLTFSAIKYAIRERCCLGTEFVGSVLLRCLTYKYPALIATQPHASHSKLIINMQFITLAILFGAVLAAPTPTPSSIPSSISSHSSDHSDLTEVKISEIRVKKHGWPIRVITSVEMRLKWGHDETTCKAYRFLTDGQDHCDNTNYDFHLDNKTLKVHTDKLGNSLTVTEDLEPMMEFQDDNCKHHFMRGTVRYPFPYFSAIESPENLIHFSRSANLIE